MTRTGGFPGIAEWVSAWIPLMRLFTLSCIVAVGACASVQSFAPGPLPRPPNPNPSPAPSPQFSILYGFKGGSDGNLPLAPLVIESDGAILGTTFEGGTGCPEIGCGTIFELFKQGARYQKRILYDFQGGADGEKPNSALVPDGRGGFFGTTLAGGNGPCLYGCGTVFQLTPAERGYRERTIYAFQSGSDGNNPEALVNSHGTLYGVTGGGGNDGCRRILGGCGTVFTVEPTKIGFAERIIYRFDGGLDGAEPVALVPAKGRFYGIAVAGGRRDFGTIFSIARSGSRYQKSTVHLFQAGSDGALPTGLTAANGALYGTTAQGGRTGCSASGSFGCGTVFEVKLAGSHQGEIVLYRFNQNHDEGNPESGVTAAADGTLYGTTSLYQPSCAGGTIFQITPTPTTYRYARLHCFERQYAAGILTLNQNVLYGCTGEGEFGGRPGTFGTVYELKP